MRRLGRIALAVVVTLALVGLFGLTAMRFVVTNWSWPTMAAAFASYAVLGFVVTLAISLLLLRGASTEAGCWPRLSPRPWVSRPTCTG